MRPKRPFSRAKPFQPRELEPERTFYPDENENEFTGIRLGRRGVDGDKKQKKKKNNIHADKYKYIFIEIEYEMKT